MNYSKIMLQRTSYITNNTWYQEYSLQNCSNNHLSIFDLDIQFVKNNEGAQKCDEVI